jgi:hypothetical protein
VSVRSPVPKTEASAGLGRESSRIASQRSGRGIRCRFSGRPVRLSASATVSFALSASGLVRALERFGPLRDGLTLATATDLLWLLNDPANYNLLVIERRWPARRFRTWLTNTMQTQLLPPPAADRRTVAR